MHAIVFNYFEFGSTQVLRNVRYVTIVQNI